MPETLKPTYGYDAAANADDSYFEVVADSATNIVYHSIEAGVTTKGAVISLDGGTTAHLVVLAGGLIGPVFVESGFVSVQAKNHVVANDYTEFWCNVW